MAVGLSSHDLSAMPVLLIAMASFADTFGVQFAGCLSTDRLDVAFVLSVASCVFHRCTCNEQLSHSRQKRKKVSQFYTRALPVISSIPLLLIAYFNEMHHVQAQLARLCRLICASAHGIADWLGGLFCLFLGATWLVAACQLTMRTQLAALQT